MQTIAYSGTKIITPYKTYDPADPSDEEFFELKLFFARREYAQIKRRMQTGRGNAERVVPARYLAIGIIPVVRRLLAFFHHAQLQILFLQFV